MLEAYHSSDVHTPTLAQQDRTRQRVALGGDCLLPLNNTQLGSSTSFQGLVTPLFLALRHIPLSDVLVACKFLATMTESAVNVRVRVLFGRRFHPLWVNTREHDCWIV